MKKITFLLVFIGFTSLLFPQNLGNYWGNQLQNCGVGAFSNNGQGVNGPKFNLHIHGTQNWTPVTYFPDGGFENGQDVGVTARFGLTNTETGRTSSDGIEMRLSGKNFYLTNQENGGNIDLNTFGIGMYFRSQTKNIYVGQIATSSPFYDHAGFNITTPLNGMLIRTLTGEKYALAIRLATEKDIAIRVMGPNAAINNFLVDGFGQTFAKRLSIQTLFSNTNNSIEVFETNGTTRNFSVNGLGKVFARKYTTTLANIPDYVFEKNYQLMSLSDLKLYISTNKHLPNIPSAKEIEAKEGEVDLGELNRLLLEKVEESMLYILQLEERIKALEEK